MGPTAQDFHAAFGGAGDKAISLTDASGVALAAIQGDLTMAELIKKFDVHANQITDWKKQLLSNASDVFGKGAQKGEESAQTIDQLHAKIGQLSVENDFLSKAFGRR